MRLTTHLRKSQRQNVLALSLATSAACVGLLSGKAQAAGQDNAFLITGVQLLDSPFKQRQDLSRTGFLSTLDPNRLLFEYRATAGLPQATGATTYGSWDSGFVRGHMAGHYLSAASEMYAATGDTSYLTKTNAVVDGLYQYQQTMGGGYASAIPLSFWPLFEADPYNWHNGIGVPFYTVHKVLAGLVEDYRYTGNTKALDVAVNMSDWVQTQFSTLTPAQINKILQTNYTAGPGNEFGGMAEALTDIYAFSAARGDVDAQRHLTLARTFCRDWFIDPTAAGQDILTHTLDGSGPGIHANTHIPQVVGWARYANVAGDAHLATAADNFFTIVLRDHTFANGGNSFGEKFSTPGLETGINGAALGTGVAETCNVYNMIKLADQLFQLSPQTRYAAYTEQALYAQILGQMNPANTAQMTYYQALQPGASKSSSYGDDTRCCDMTGIENTPRYNESIYFHTADTLWVNQFIPSQVQWAEKGITLRQESQLQQNDTLHFTLSAASPANATVNLRIPNWAFGTIGVTVNGTPFTGTIERGNYVALNRQWQTGDTIDLQVPKKLYLRRSQDDPSLISVFYGPILLAGLWSSSTMPVLDSTNADPSQWLQLSDPATLTFTTTGLSANNGISFKPFYDINGTTRFSVYWKMNAPTAIRNWRGGGMLSDIKDGTNWDTAPGPGDTLRFDGNFCTTVNNAHINARFGGVQFAPTASPFTLTGNSATIGDITNDSANPQVMSMPVAMDTAQRTLNTGAAGLTLSGGLISTVPVVKTGSGTLTLGGSLQFAGGATVQAGTLHITSSNTSGDINNQSALVFEPAADAKFSGKITGTGSLTKTGPASLTLLGQSSYSGPTTIQQGTLKLGATTAPILTHRWSFNGNYTDAAGTSNATMVETGSNNATLSSTQVTLAGGTRTTADYIQLGSGLLPKNGTPVTLELWATQLSAKNWSRVFDFGSTNNNNVFMSWTNGTTLATDRVEWMDAVRTTSDNTNAPYTLNQEFHLALVIEPGAGASGATRVTWYSAPANGTSLGTPRGTFDTTNTLANLSDTNAWLGRSEYTGDSTANAAYDEFRIWNSALTADQLQLTHVWGVDHSLDPSNFLSSARLPATTAMTIGPQGVFDLGGLNQTLASLTTAPGSAVILSGGTLTVTGLANIGGAILDHVGLLQPADGLSVTDNTKIADPNATTVVSGALSVAPGKTLDLDQSTLIVKGAPDNDNLLNLVRTGRSGSAGITSSAASPHAALAIVRLGDPHGLTPADFPNGFDGQTLADGDVLIKLTACGDADFNGTIDSLDYDRLDAGFDGAFAGWANGDFNLDGTIDATDYALIDSAFKDQGSPLADQMIAAHTAQFGGLYTQTMTNLATASAPEPATLSALALGTLALLSRRRRSR